MHTLRLPPPSPQAAHSSAQLTQLIAQTIAQCGGSLPFPDWMQLILYAPQWGYYTGGSHKIGATGDFITAPTLSPLFAQTLSVQILELLTQTDGNVYEFGAGTGALAADLLNELAGSLKNYYIIELSGDLIQRQQEYIQARAPKYADKVIWLTTLPEQFDGILIGNEVLDAMPVERIRYDEQDGFKRAHITHENQKFAWQYHALNDERLRQAAQQYFPLISGYTSELHPQQFAFIQTLAAKLQRGAMIWLDYGFDAAQYYHPQRTDGTLIGHYRHHSLHDPFYQVGLCDLTAHVNFSDIAEAGVSSGLDLIGYTTQAHFLFNLGLLDILTTRHPQDKRADYLQAAHAVQQLTATYEMGELFKVIAFGKHVDVYWRGFAQGDLCYKL